MGKGNCKMSTQDKTLFAPEQDSSRRDLDPKVNRFADDAELGTEEVDIAKIERVYR